MASSPEAKATRDPGIGGRLRAAAGQVLRFVRGEPAGLREPADLSEVVAEAGVSGDEVVVIEEWVEPAEDEGAGPGWHGGPVLGWYRTEAAEGRDPNVGPTPRPGGPRPGSPRPGGPRPGVRPSGPPAE